MTFVDVEPSDSRLGEIFTVLVELRPHLDIDLFREIYTAGYAEGLRFTGLYEDGVCVAVAGWRILNTTHMVKQVHVDDLVSSAHARSTGHGRALLKELETRARDYGCRAIELDSNVQRFGAHRFYLRERMQIEGHHFVKRFDDL